MSKKQLNTEAILNELKGGSLFFPQASHAPIPTPEKNRAATPVVPPEHSTPAELTPIPSGLPKPIREPSTDRAITPANPDASPLARYPDGLINTIRKIVKSTGKEVSFVRLTLEEKKQLVDIVYSYKSQGIKTSETEINRIAVNFLLEDYQA
ncbi:MAG: hypothetical protein HY259_03625, partial [Chloroflexi bacterium]|nr:hypothetical protein [Chloroflexota bacterium]